MRSWGWVTVLGLAVAAPAFAQKQEDEAGDTSEVDKDAVGPLRDRVRPVSGHLFLMKGRFEVSPGVAISVRDAFFTKFVFGAAFTYHITEELAVSLRGGYAAPIISGAAQICVPADPANGVSAGCRLPTFEELTTVLNPDGSRSPQNRAWGLLHALGSLDLQWAPIYGKLSLVAERFLHFNMYALLGGAVILYGPTNAVTGGGNVGVGFRFFLNKWLTVRMELRDTIYVEKGFIAGAEKDSVRNQLSIELGLSMFLPTTMGEQR